MWEGEWDGRGGDLPLWWVVAGSPWVQLLFSELFISEAPELFPLLVPQQVPSFTAKLLSGVV